MIPTIKKQKQICRNTNVHMFQTVEQHRDNTHTNSQYIDTKLPADIPDDLNYSTK